MPSTSESQRRLFGMVLAAKRGELKNPSSKVKGIANQVSEGQAKDFASEVVKKKRRQIVDTLSTRG